MLTKQERKNLINSFDEKKERLEKEIADINKSKNRLNKSLIFEDTLQGMILEEEDKAEEAILEIIKDLSESTGYVYSFRFDKRAVDNFSRPLDAIPET